MNEEGKAVSTSLPKIINKIREIRSALVQAEEDCSLTTSQLMELIHGQTRELALIFHQLIQLHPGKDKS